jgi:hypothetical protein
MHSLIYLSESSIADISMVSKLTPPHLQTQQDARIWREHHPQPSAGVILKRLPFLRPVQQRHERRIREGVALASHVVGCENPTSV